MLRRTSSTQKQLISQPQDGDDVVYNENKKIKTQKSSFEKRFSSVWCARRKTAVEK